MDPHTNAGRFGATATQLAGMTKMNGGMDTGSYKSATTMGGRRGRRGRNTYGKGKRPFGNRQTFRKKKMRGSRSRFFGSQLFGRQFFR